MEVQLRRVSEEVYYADGPIVAVSRKDIEWLKQAALGTQRKRVRLCAHPDVQHSLHEMLIVHTKSAYVRPHKHLHKAESFHLIEGEVDVVFFDDAGAIQNAVHMVSGASDGSFFYRVSGPQYHTLLIRSEFLVFHEATSGPFLREQTAFAPWAPAEDDPAGQAEFLRTLDQALRQFSAA